MLKDSTPPIPRAKGSCRHTHLLHGLSDFVFVTQLQFGDGQDHLNSLQFLVYVMNELRGEALFYQGQVLGHFERQEKDDTHAPGQGQLGNLKQQRKHRVRPLESKSLGLRINSKLLSPLLWWGPGRAFPASSPFNNVPPGYCFLAARQLLMFLQKLGSCLFLPMPNTNWSWTYLLKIFSCGSKELELNYRSVFFPKVCLPVGTDHLLCSEPWTRNGDIGHRSSNKMSPWSKGL